MPEIQELSPIQGIATCRFADVTVNSLTLTDVATIRVKSPGLLLISGALNQNGGGTGTGLTNLEFTRATDYGGDHVSLASSAAIITPASANPAALTGAILQATANAQVTPTNSIFQVLLDASVGKEFKVRAAGPVAGQTLQLKVSAHDRSFLQRPA